MKPKLREILLMLLKASGNKVSGKTKIHKECYLLSIKMGQSSEFQFRPHYYGPYSPVVDYSLSELIGIGFILEQKLSWGIDQSGFEVVRYDYVLTAEGEKAAISLAENYKKEYRQIENFVKTLQEIGDPNYMQLAAASKAYSILHKEGKKMTPHEIKQKAKDFNWKLLNDDINKAEKILEHLGLIQQSKTN